MKWDQFKHLAMINVLLIAVFTKTALKSLPLGSAPGSADQLDSKQQTRGQGHGDPLESTLQCPGEKWLHTPTVMSSGQCPVSCRAAVGMGTNVVITRPQPQHAPRLLRACRLCAVRGGAQLARLGSHGETQKQEQKPRDQPSQPSPAQW